MVIIRTYILLLISVIMDIEDNRVLFKFLERVED